MFHRKPANQVPESRPSPSPVQSISSLGASSITDLQQPLERAKVSDLFSMIRILKCWPDDHPQAQSRGFLRPRFSPDEYRQLIGDGCIRVIRDGEKIIGFINVLPWAHPLISQERLAAKSFFCHWTGKDYSAALKNGNITYFAEIAADPFVAYSGSRLLRTLGTIRAETPNNYLVGTYSQAPIANVHSAEQLRRCGFELIGYVKLPFRPMKVGPYPGRIGIVSPFQSNIVCMQPLNSDVPPER